MKTTQALIFIVIVATGINTAHAQRVTEIGVTGGINRFYPEAQNLGLNLNNTMKNGWGWTTGVYIEDHWKPNLYQIIEINYYSLKSDIYMKKYPDAPWSPYDGTEQQPIIGNYKDTPFNTISLAGGIKYFLRNKLYVYPGFEVSKSLNKDIDINKTTYNAKLGFGLDYKHFDLIMQYTYGLNFQRTVYDPTVPFVSTHRNQYLQFKVQIPLYRLR